MLKTKLGHLVSEFESTTLDTIKLLVGFFKVLILYFEPVFTSPVASPYTSSLSIATPILLLNSVSRPSFNDLLFDIE